MNYQTKFDLFGLNGIKFPKGTPVVEINGEFMVKALFTHAGNVEVVPEHKKEVLYNIVSNLDFDCMSCGPFDLQEVMNRLRELRRKLPKTEGWTHKLEAIK